MNDDNIVQDLQARKRALKHAIREERLRLNAIDREARKRERVRKLKDENDSLAREAHRLGIVL
jgi:hypothetical protein